MQRVIALVEDDDIIRENYTELLTRAGFTVSAYATKETAESAFREKLPDLALLDISLVNERDAGFQLCADLRKSSPTLPIVFLTSHGAEVDKISGMRVGADDYITKDASLDYIVVRLEALFRRFQAIASRSTNSVSSSQLTLDRECSRAKWKGHELNLTLTQYWMLEALAGKPGVVKSHDDIMKAAKIRVEPNTIVAHIKLIRETIRAVDPDFDCIKTERGLGYRWKE